MKAVKVFAQIVGGICIAVAALMFFVGDTGSMVTVLIGGIVLLVIASKLHKPSSSVEGASFRKALQKAEDAAWHAKVQAEIKTEEIAAMRHPFRQAGQQSSRQYVNRDLPIPSEFRTYFEDYLRENGRLEDLPKFYGRNDALGYILAGEDCRTRARFFAYAVDCERHGKTMGDIRKAKNMEKYEQFVDFVDEHEELHRSIYGRPADDYWNPSHNTKIYKAASVWFP